MEVISAVSGVAGILSLLGQTIQSTKKLKGFFTDVTSASESVKLLLSDVDFLLTTFHHVSNLVDALPPEFEDSQIVTLRSKLESYREESSRWIKTAGKLRPASDIGARMWFKKFRIAVNIKSVTDLRNVLDTHKQNINLSLNLLGRALELSTAAGVGQLDRKVTVGTAASLSKIEEQNDLLEVIESYSRSSMQSSAASVKSLQSIATSLSRIEALASTVSVSAYDDADESGNADLKDYTRAKSIRRTRTPSVDTRDIGGKHRSHARRRSDGDVDLHGRRLSTKSHDSGRSSTSVKSLPAVPVIPAVYQLTKNSEPFDKGLSGSRFKPVTRTQAESQQNFNGDAGSQHADDRSSEFSSPQGNADKYLEADARIQDDCWSRLLQHLTKQQGPLVAHYISLKRSIYIYECQLRLFSLVNQELDTSLAWGSEFRSVTKEKKVLQGRVESLKEDLKIFRKTFIELGISLYGIDLLIGGNTTNKNPHQFWDQYNAPFELHSTEMSTPELTEGGKLFVHGEWSTDRDRVNRWLLHCLQSDQSQRQLHKSMLAEIPNDPNVWRRQVLQHWYVDEAAVGGEFHFSPSVGAVQYDVSSDSDSSAGREEAMVNKLQRLFPMNDSAGSWDFGIPTAEDIRRLLQADEKLLPLSTRRWIDENGHHTHKIPIHKSLKALVDYWDLARCGKTYALQQTCHTAGMRDFSAGVYYLLDSTRRLENPSGVKCGRPRLRCPKELRQDRKALLLSLSDFLEGEKRIETIRSQPSLAEVEDAIFDDLTYSAFKLVSKAVKYTKAWSRLIVEKQSIPSMVSPSFQ